MPETPITDGAAHSSSDLPNYRESWEPAVGAWVIYGLMFGVLAAIGWSELSWPWVPWGWCALALLELAVGVGAVVLFPATTTWFDGRAVRHRTPFRVRTVWLDNVTELGVWARPEATPWLYLCTAEDEVEFEVVPPSRELRMAIGRALHASRPVLVRRLDADTRQALCLDRRTGAPSTSTVTEPEIRGPYLAWLDGMAGRRVRTGPLMVWFFVLAGSVALVASFFASEYAVELTAKLVGAGFWLVVVPIVLSRSRRARERAEHH